MSNLARLEALVLEYTDSGECRECGAEVCRNAAHDPDCVIGQVDAALRVASSGPSPAAPPEPSPARIEGFTIRLREYVRVRGGGVDSRLWGELTDEQRAAWLGSATELLHDLLRVDRGASAPVPTGESGAAESGGR